MIKMMALLVLLPCAAMATGRSVQVDPGFPYYLDRSPESIVEEIKANGFDDVRVACTSESGIKGGFVKALKDAGMKAWMMTFGNGVYSTVDLPEGWKSWRMKYKGDVEQTSGFIYLCLNNPAYRQWKKKQLTEALTKHPFYGLDIAESFIPAYGGPETVYYGCLCDNCAAAFRRMYPGVPGTPEFVDTKSPRYYKTDKALYEKWMGFRVSTVVGYLDDLVNGKGGIREKCPNVKVSTWSLGLAEEDGLKKLREWEALDGAAIVRRVKPDMHVIQTDWPDWIKAGLPADYVTKYKTVADSIREVAPDLPLMIQTDIGSQQQMRRSRAWMKDCEAAAIKIGVPQVTYYEYFLGDYIYTEPPAVFRAESSPGQIKLVFNKRLDPMSATNISNYTLSSGKVDFAKLDGNIVTLSVSGTGDEPTVTVNGISDDETRRFFHDKPACTMADEVQVTPEPAPEKTTDTK